MNIEKLLKRFMKESGIYGSNASKEILLFMTDYDEAILPFNAFRWDTTDNGHNYWYTKAMEWVLYLYDNIDSIDDEEKAKMGLSESKIRLTLFEMMKYYCLENSSEVELMNIDAYKRVKELYNKLKEKNGTIDAGF